MIRRSQLFVATFIGLLACASAIAFRAGSGTFDLSWHTIDGGGGESSGQTFALQGTIGQVDAGTTMSGTTFALTGGFWPGIAIDVETCVGDISDNGLVDVDDLLVVINGWGLCDKPCPPQCAGDIAPTGGNCAINVDDLLAVINAWGQCP